MIDLFLGCLEIIISMLTVAITWKWINTEGNNIVIIIIGILFSTFMLFLGMKYILESITIKIHVEEEKDNNAS